MKEDLKKASANPRKGFIEKRHEERHEVPDRFQTYMTLHIKAGDRHIPAVLANFSRHGILFETTAPIEQGSRRECSLKLTLLVVREVSFWIDVKYCYPNNGSYIVGAQVNGVADATWFDFFEEIYDFIVLRKDSA